MLRAPASARRASRPTSASRPVSKELELRAAQLTPHAIACAEFHDRGWLSRHRAGDSLAARASATAAASGDDRRRAVAAHMYSVRIAMSVAGVLRRVLGPGVMGGKEGQEIEVAVGAALDAEIYRLLTDLQARQSEEQRRPPSLDGLSEGEQLRGSQERLRFCLELMASVGLRTDELVELMVAAGSAPASARPQHKGPAYAPSTPATSARPQRDLNETSIRASSPLFVCISHYHHAVTRFLVLT